MRHAKNIAPLRNVFEIDFTADRPKGELVDMAFHPDGALGCDESYA
jgi:hypothetical protein